MFRIIISRMSPELESITGVSWLLHVQRTLLVGGQFGNLLADCLGENFKQKVHRAVLSVRARAAAGCPVYPWLLGLRSPPRVWSLVAGWQEVGGN